MPKKARPRTARAKPRREGVKRIDVKLPPGLYERVREQLKHGQYFSMSDFGRAAIREKLEALGTVRKK